MTPEHERAAAALFQAVLDRPAEERARYLAGIGGPDDAVRARVQQLLDADAGASAAFAPLRDGAATIASEPTAFRELPADSIPGYQILNEIHRGGQGVVYAALHRTTRRKVAIKVMREGPFAGAADRARFEREVHILGQLEHPNIVAIHDTGRAAGCDYFVMDYVSGVPLDRWLDEHGGATLRRFGSSAGAETAAPDGRRSRDRRRISSVLQLFARICEAVNAAHLRGVIHRDLKPGNIRVDEAGEPHILDFGLAKVLVPQNAAADSGSGAAAPEMTVTGQFLGSLPWASPEQAEAQPSLVDIRTDVYALGVILYQAVTGCFPYDVAGNLRDVLDRILRAEPIRPRTLSRQVNDELETIILKCLQKDRARRYQSAGELGRDVRAFLAGEPIAAKRDSFAYVVRTHLRRHLAATYVAAAFVVLVAGGAVAVTAFWLRAVHERDAAIAARQGEAEQAATAAAVTAFVQDMLGAADPAAAQANRDIRVRDVLDRAARRLSDGVLRERPAVEAGVRHAIGRTYQSLGLLDEAEVHLKRALELLEGLYGRDHARTAPAISQYALLLQECGALADAEAQHRRALRLARQDLKLAAGDEGRYLNNLGAVLWTRGKLDEADTVLAEADARLGGAVPAGDAGAIATRASCRSNQAALAHVRGRFREAADGYSEALRLLSLTLHGPHPELIRIRQNRAAAQLDGGEAAEAETTLRQALAEAEAIYAPDHPAIATVLGQLGQVLRELGRDHEAADLLARSRAIFERGGPAPTPPRAIALNEEGFALWNQGRLPEAEAAFRQALLVYQAIAGAKKRDVALVLNNLAGVLRERGALDEALRLAQRALRRLEEPPPDDELTIAVACNNVALTLQAAGRAADALPLAQRCVQIRRANLPAGDWQTANARTVLGGVLSDLGRHAEAEPHLREGYAELRDEPRVPDRFRRAARERLVRLYEQWGRVDEAAQWRAADGEQPQRVGAAPPTP